MPIRTVVSRLQDKSVLVLHRQLRWVVDFNLHWAERPPTKDPHDSDESGSAASIAESFEFSIRP